MKGRKEGRGRIIFRLVILLLCSVGVFALTGCSGNSQIVTPDVNNLIGPTEPDLGMFRNLLWDGDEFISGEVGEKNADITNVVYDHSFYVAEKAGMVKYEGYPVDDDFTYTVAAWQVPEDGYTDIAFRVLFLDESDQWDETEIFTVPNPDEDYYRWPAVTAYYRSTGCIMVDIVFQALPNEGGDWEIKLVRYIQEYAQDFDGEAFIILPNPTSIWPIYGEEGKNCIHPDIVFDSANNEHDTLNSVHIVFEVNEGYVTGSDIHYMKFTENSMSLEPELAYEWVISDQHGADYNQRPRIDVGWDDSTLAYYLSSGELTSLYNVGVAWNTMEFDGPDSKANVIYTLFLAIMSPSSHQYTDSLTTADWFEYHVFPYVEIDPVELGTGVNDPRYNHIFWTKTWFDELEENYEEAVVNAHNSERFCQYGATGYIELIQTSEFRYGLPSFATFTAEDAEDRKGWLTWAYDTGPADSTVEVWAGELQYEIESPWGYSLNSTEEEIYDGHTSIIGPYVYGPEVAIFNVDFGGCVWTECDEYGDTIGILNDCSDW